MAAGHGRSIAEHDYAHVRVRVETATQRMFSSRYEHTPVKRQHSLPRDHRARRQRIIRQLLVRQTHGLKRRLRRQAIERAVVAHDLDVGVADLHGHDDVDGHIESFAHDLGRRGTRPEVCDELRFGCGVAQHGGGVAEPSRAAVEDFWSQDRTAVGEDAFFCQEGEWVATGDHVVIAAVR